MFQLWLLLLEYNVKNTSLITSKDVWYNVEDAVKGLRENQTGVPISYYSMFISYSTEIN